MGRSIRTGPNSRSSPSNRKTDRARSRLPRGMVAAILIVAALLAAEVARLATANALATTRPQVAEILAPSYPEVLASIAMAEVGEAAAYGRTPPASAMERLHRLARVAPLRTEPFLVEGAIAQRNSDFARSERLLLEARQRDPRSAAARYLLADTWIRQGRIADALGEMGVFARLVPGSSGQLAPVLSEYARTPGAIEQLKQILAANLELKHPLLKALAEDPDNAALILDLDASVPGPVLTRSPQWHAMLLNGFIGRGDYERAYALWQRFSGFRGSRPLLFNGDFRQVSAPPPFNWSFASGRGGLAEPVGGQMRVLHYGRANATLASQLLLLAPGQYRLSLSFSGKAARGALAWEVRCVPDKRPLMRLELGRANPARADFEVPAGGCGAQKLELIGLAPEEPQESDLLVGPVSLERIAR